MILFPEAPIHMWECSVSALVFANSRIERWPGKGGIITAIIGYTDCVYRGENDESAMLGIQLVNR